MSNKGEIDETCWNEESIEKVKGMKPGQLSFPDRAEVYCASKSLAEKGKQILIKARSQLRYCYCTPAAWDFYEKNKDTIKWSLATVLPSMVRYVP